jgi:hypothetical protein
MIARLIAEAAGLFTITNFNDIVILALFFGRGAGQHGSARRSSLANTSRSPPSSPSPSPSPTGPASCPNKPSLTWACSPIGLGLWEAWKLWKNRGGDSHSGRHMEAGSVLSLDPEATTAAAERLRADGTDQRTKQGAEPARNEQANRSRLFGGARRDVQERRPLPRWGDGPDVSEIAVSDGVRSEHCLSGSITLDADRKHTQGQALDLDAAAQALHRPARIEPVQRACLTGALRAIATWAAGL